MTSAPTMGKKRIGKRFDPPIVLLVHGIRTYGQWQKKVGAMLSRNGIPFEAYDYGFFPLRKFLRPGYNRRMVDDFYDSYGRLIRESALDLKTYATRPSVAAHSFGTYMVGECMRHHPDVKFDKVLFCGSILPVDFNWKELFDRDQVHLVRNESGAQDVWTRVVGHFVRHTGSSGNQGFTFSGKGFEQQPFKYFRHSDYFMGTHVEAHWLPFFRKGHLGFFVRHGRIHRFAAHDDKRKREYETLLDQLHYQIDNPNYGGDPNYGLHRLPRGLSITWVGVEPDIYTLLMAADGTPKGYIDALPLTDEAYDLIKSDRLPDPEILAHHVRPFHRGAVLRMYGMSIGLAPEVQKSSATLYRETFRQLIDAFLDKLIYYGRVEAVRVTRLLAAAWTEQGKKLCRQLDMESLGTDALGHPISELDFERRRPGKAEERFPKLRELLEVYRGL